MSGLEAVEVKLSEVKTSSDILRVDSFFFAKEFLHDKQKLLEMKSCDLSFVCDDLRSFGAYSLNNDVTYRDSGIPFIRCVNMRNGFIDFSDLLYIDKQANELLCKSAIKPNTVLLSMSGSVGNVAYAQENWDYPINSNQDIAKILFNDSYNPYVAYVFMLSKFGQNFMIREARGSVQQHVYLSQIEKMRLPIFSNNFCKAIERAVRLSHAARDNAGDLYKSAESLLLAELGLGDFTPSAEPVAVKSFSESFGASGRLDAEYYQPKYEDVLFAISNSKTDLLSNLVLIKKSIEPGSSEYTDEGIPFVRVSDITKFGITNPEIHISRVPFANMELQPIKDTILFTKDGTVGIAYKAEKDMDIVTSSAILHLTVKDKNELLPDYLTLVLNSMIVQMQAERDTGGSVIIHWRPSDIGNVVIPILEKHKQEEIADLVQQSFDYRFQSEQLLETAKHVVEIAIEQGEASAIQLLQEV